MPWNISEGDRQKGREARQASKDARLIERQTAEQNAKTAALAKFGLKIGDKVYNQHEAETKKLPWEWCNSKYLHVNRMETTQLRPDDTSWPHQYRITASLECSKCHRQGVFKSGGYPQMDQLSVFKPKS